MQKETGYLQKDSRIMNTSTEREKLRLHWKSKPLEPQDFQRQKGDVFISMISNSLAQRLPFKYLRNEPKKDGENES